MSSNEPRTHFGGPSRCTHIGCLQGYGTDNHNCGICLVCLEASTAPHLPASHDHDLMQEGFTFPHPAPANPCYHEGPSWTGPPAAGPAGVPGTGVPGTEPAAFLDANNNAAILGYANVNASVPAPTPFIILDGVTWWTDGYDCWPIRLDHPLVDCSSTASTSPGGPLYDGDNPNHRTVATPASSPVTTPASSVGLSPASNGSAKPFGCFDCEWSFQQRKDLIRHVKTVHFTDANHVWRCICGKQQRRKDNHRRHVRNCTRGPPPDDYVWAYVCACLHQCAHDQEHLRHLDECRVGGTGPRGRPRSS